jgi:hypothetical protein
LVGKVESQRRPPVADGIRRRSLAASVAKRS